MAGRQRAVLVAFRDHHQSGRLIAITSSRNTAIFIARGCRHAVVARPGAVILMPLPHVALERGLGVDLELVDVDAFVEQLPQRIDQPRMVRQQAKRFIICMRGEGGARRAGLFAPDLLPVGFVDLLGFRVQDRDLVLGIKPRQQDRQGPCRSGKACELLGLEVSWPRSLVVNPIRRQIGNPPKAVLAVCIRLCRQFRPTGVNIHPAGPARRSALNGHHPASCVHHYCLWLEVSGLPAGWGALPTAAPNTGDIWTWPSSPTRSSASSRPPPSR